MVHEGEEVTSSVLELERKPVSILKKEEKGREIIVNVQPRAKARKGKRGQKEVLLSYLLK